MKNLRSLLFIVTLATLTATPLRAMKSNARKPNPLAGMYTDMLDALKWATYFEQKHPNELVKDLNNFYQPGRTEPSPQLLQRCLNDLGITLGQIKSEYDGQTPLHWAACFGYTKVANLLLGTGAYHLLFTRDIYGRTPLHVAVCSGNREVVSAILNGASPYASPYGLPYALAGSRCNGAYALVYIWDFGGNTALHYAVRFGHTSIVLELLKTSPSRIASRYLINKRNVNGWTACDIAEGRNNKLFVHEDIKLILDAYYKFHIGSNELNSFLQKYGHYH